MDKVMSFANKKYTSRSSRQWIHLLIAPYAHSSIYMAKLSPQYCGSWMIIKEIREIVYKLDLRVRSHICVKVLC